MMPIGPDRLYRKRPASLSQHRSPRYWRAAAPAIVAAILMLLALCLALRAVVAHAQELAADPLPVPLGSVAVPGPPPAVLEQYVQDSIALVQLGKAFYWD